MTANDWGQLILYFVVLALLAKPLGWYMARVYQGEPSCGMERALGWLERGVYRIAGVNPKEMGSAQIAVGVLLFNGIGFLAVYALSAGYKAYCRSIRNIFRPTRQTLRSIRPSALPRTPIGRATAAKRR